MILIVEDETALRENMQELLSLSGYEVAVAANGRAAIEWLNLHQASLIICDVMMPELDGMALLALIQQHPEWTKIPFLFLSAKAEIRIQEEGIQNGAAMYMTKPFTHSDLIQNIEKLLHLSSN